MDFRTAYTHRLEKATRRQQRLAALAAFGVTAGVAALLVPELIPTRAGNHVYASSVVQAAASVLRSSAPAQASAARPVYPYSIIPGGVSGVAELKRIIRSDRVVAAHYASFNVDAATEVTVTKPRAVYVSYRKGEQVFWTAKKIMLVQGETLLTDGANEMRARCANRISDVAQFPVETHGPSEAELDAAIAAMAGQEDEQDGGFMAASAAGIGAEDDGAGSGQRFQTMSFPNGAGLLLSAAAPAASARAATPYVPHADRSALYNGGLASRSSRAGDAAAAQGGGATPPASGAGATLPATGNDTSPGTGGNSGTPGADVPTTGNADPVKSGGNSGGAGDPANGGSNGNGGTGSGVPGTGNGNSGNGGSSGGGTSGDPAAPATPNPQTGPGLPQDGPATPGPTSPLPHTPGDSELPTAPTEMPEPGTMWLSAAAASALLWMRRRKK